jgi:hypothetical protein
MLLKVFRDIVVSKVDRVSNGIAHVLAQLHKAGFNVSLSNDSPDYVREMISVEMM